jgi:exodeoxyribonuclease VII large subunit
MSESGPVDAAAGAANTPVGLKAYLAGIADVVKRVPAAWVRCELHALKIQDRFVRMEFIEVDGDGKQVAKVQGGCWPAVWQRIDADFRAAGLPLEAGSQVLVKLDANLSATFGFQVTVSDIDLTFALGDLNARMQSIRKNLQDAGIWGQNRSLPRPTDFVRVSVIAPAGAAGLGDFRSTADGLARAGLAEFVYHEVPFQTRDAPARIVEKLRAIYRDCGTDDGRHCAVAIIRGGGASADLAWLVDQKLAEAVCLMNVPVMTGIGHERDRNLLDEIACIPCDTPSKVAEYINSTITRTAMEGHRALETIAAQGAQILSRHESAILATRNAVETDARETLRLAAATVRTVATDLEPGARALLDNTQTAVATASEETRFAARQRREAATHAIQDLRRNIVTAVEAALRPLELGVAGARKEIVTRVDALPQTVSDDIIRLRATIAGEATRIVDSASDEVGALREQFNEDARRTLQDCSSAIAMIQERADSVHPRTVLAAGYAILRDRGGSPLTSSEAVRAAALVTAEMRDGTTRLRHDQPAPLEGM